MFCTLFILMACFAVSARQTVWIQVQNQNGTPLPGARVEAENEQAFSHSASLTNAMGWARFPGLSSAVDLYGGNMRLNDFLLVKNYPNPFCRHTTISICLRRSMNVHTAVYNIRGRCVADFGTRRLNSGWNGINWSGSAADGKRMAAGIYFAVVETQGKRYVRKMLFTSSGTVGLRLNGTQARQETGLAKPALLAADRYRFVVSDTMLPPRFVPLDTTGVSLQDTLIFVVHAAKKHIAKIAAAGPVELVWDWEVYHDPNAITYRATNGKSNTFDSPPHFWKDADGNIYCVAANGVNYRVPFTKDLTPERALNFNDIIFNSAKTYPAGGGRYYHQGYGENYLAGSCAEKDYDNNIWVFGLWTDDGENVYALGHHEYYPKTCPVGTTAPWMNAIHYLSSSDGGKMFLPNAYTPFATSGKSNADRLVLIPKPWAPDNPDHINYGFYHPSNIVREGNYYYAIAEGNFWLGTTQDDYGLHEGGFLLIRSRDVSSPLDWQVYTENGWESIDHNAWQGYGGQAVKLWHKHGPYDPYHEYPRGGQLLSFSLVQHLPSGQWIALGYSNQGATTVQYSLSASLQNPDFGPITTVLNAPVLNLGQYMSLVGPDSPGFVFQYVKDDCYLYFIAPNNAPQIPQVLQKPVSDAHSRSMWRVPIKITTDDEG